VGSFFWAAALRWKYPLSDSIWCHEWKKWGIPWGE